MGLTQAPPDLHELLDRDFDWDFKNFQSSQFEETGKILQQARMAVSEDTLWRHIWFHVSGSYLSIPLLC